MHPELSPHTRVSPPQCDSGEASKTKKITFSEPFYSPDLVWALAVGPGEELLKAPAVMDWVQALGVWGLLGTSG